MTFDPASLGPGGARHGKAGHGKAWLGKARLGKARLGLARHGMARTRGTRGWQHPHSRVDFRANHNAAQCGEKRGVFAECRNCKNVVRKFPT